MTKLAERLRPLLGNPNVQAFLHVIREGESSHDDGAYFMRWPGKKFDDLTRHPRIFEPGPNGPSSAAGAYQITYTTYADFAPKLGVDDFSRTTQDLIALAIIDAEGALPYVYAGDIVPAIEALGGRWASFPSSTAGQRTVKMQRLVDVFGRFGGTATQPARDGPPVPPRVSPPPEPAPAAPITTEPKMPLPIAVSVGLATELWKLLRPTQKVAEIAGVIEKAAPALLEAAKTAVPTAVNEQQAVEQIKANPQLQMAFKAQTMSRWDDIAPMWEAEEKSRREAREFGEQLMTTGPQWRQIGAGVLVGALSLTIIVGGGAMFWSLMSSPQLDPGQKGLILGALLSVFSSTAAYWFGSSASSRIKDTTIADQAAKR